MRRWVWMLWVLAGSCADISEPSPASGLSSTGPSPSIVPTALQLDDLTTDTGVTFRWRSDPSKCMTRNSESPTAGDLLSLATCSHDIRQAWICLNGLCVADSNHSFGIRTSAHGSLSVESDANFLVLLKARAGSMSLYNARAGAGLGYASSSDANGTLGQPVVLAPASAEGSSQTLWDVTGTGPSTRGTTLALNGSKAWCLRQENAGVTLAACDVSQATQRWSLSRGTLVCDAGQYLAVDATQSPPALTLSSSASGSLGQETGWSFFAQGLQSNATAASGESIYLTGDGNTLRVTAETGANGSFWLWGGSASYR